MYRLFLVRWIYQNHTPLLGKMWYMHIECDTSVEIMFLADSKIDINHCCETSWNHALSKYYLIMHITCIINYLIDLNGHLFDMMQSNSRSVSSYVKWGKADIKNNFKKQKNKKSVQCLKKVLVTPHFFSYFLNYMHKDGCLF